MWMQRQMISQLLESQKAQSDKLDKMHGLFLEIRTELQVRVTEITGRQLYLEKEQGRLDNQLNTLQQRLVGLLIAVVTAVGGLLIKDLAQ